MKDVDMSVNVKVVSDVEFSVTFRDYKQMRTLTVRSDYPLLRIHTETTELEKNFGVMICSDLKFSKQCIEEEKNTVSLHKTKVSL